MARTKEGGKLAAADSTPPSDEALAPISAEEVLAKNNLTVKNVEPKGSCWLLAVLANVRWALENPVNPTVLDRLVDYHIRQAIHKACLSYCNQNFNKLGDQEFEDLAETIAHIHELPTQGKKRGTPGQFGWVPANGWAGSTAFRFLSP